MVGAESPAADDVRERRADTPSPWESFVQGQYLRIEKAGSLPYDRDMPAKNPAFIYSISERQAFKELLRAGKCELEYELDAMVIRIKREAPPPAPLPYEESPAVLALRARRRELGR